MHHKKRIILSHSSQDSAKANFLAETLRECGFDVWFDPEQHGFAAYRQALKTSPDTLHVFAVLLSKASLSSLQVSRQIVDALELAREHDNFLLASVLIETEYPIPPLLSRYYHVDLTTGNPEAELLKFMRMLDGSQQTSADEPVPPSQSAPLPASSVPGFISHIGSIKGDNVTVNVGETITNAITKK